MLSACHYHKILFLFSYQIHSVSLNPFWKTMCFASEYPSAAIKDIAWICLCESLADQVLGIMGHACAAGEEWHIKDFSKWKRFQTECPDLVHNISIGLKKMFKWIYSNYAGRVCVLVITSSYRAVIAHCIMSLFKVIVSPDALLKNINHNVSITVDLSDSQKDTSTPCNIGYYHIWNSHGMPTEQLHML